MDPSPRRALLVATLATLATVAAVACGGAPPTEPATGAGEAAPTERVVARGDRAVTARVGPPGGSLELDNGARLDVPPGALGEAAQITFAIGADTDAFSRRDDQAPVGATLVVVPALSSADAPFVVSVPLLTLPSGFGRDELALATEEVDREQRALGMGGTQTRWYLNPARVVDQRLVGELPALSGQRLQFVVAR